MAFAASNYVLDSPKGISAGTNLTRASSSGSTILINLTLRDLPKQLEFNSKHVSNRMNEYEWGAFIDSDGNLTTGYNGFDLWISLQGRKNSTEPYNASVVDGTKRPQILEWKDKNMWNSLGYWLGGVYYSPVDITVRENYPANSIEIFISKSKELALVNETSRFYFKTAYESPMGLVSDTTNLSNGSSTIEDPAGDVPFGFIDIIKGSLKVINETSESLAPAGETHGM